MAFDLVKFNNDTHTIMSEKVDQEVSKFNEASRGAIVLRTGSNRGDFSSESFFKNINGLVRRRDANGSGAISAVSLAQGEHTGVKIAAGTPELAYERQQYAWTMQNPELAAVIIGEQLAVAQVQDMLNASVLGLSSAMQDAGVIHSATGGVASLGGLNSGAAKFGDRSSSLMAWIMHSKVAHDVYGSALANANQLFEFGTVNVLQDGFGRVFIVTDSDPLINLTADPDEYTTLGLTAGAAIIEPNNDFDAAFVKVTGNENITTKYQAEWTYNLKLKGYSWDKANGGASPSDTALGTATNWDLVASSLKDTAGVKVITQ